MPVSDNLLQLLVVSGKQGQSREISGYLWPEPLLIPFIGAMLRYLSKWEMWSDLAPIFSDIAKHKGKNRSK